MKLKIVTVQVVLLLSISTAAMAQNSNPGIPKAAQVDRPDAPEESMHGVMAPPIGTHEVPSEPATMATPANIPGGLYHVGNGYLSCPDVLPLTNGRPNLSGCTYRKEMH